jgi:hypothetical protein
MSVQRLSVGGALFFSVWVSVVLKLVLAFSFLLF